MSNQSRLPLFVLFLLAVMLSFSYASSVSGRLSLIKSYADSFNQSRNAQTPNGPVEQTCWTSGTFLAYHYCSDIPTCTQTANLVCITSGQQGCELDVLAADILDYKNGVDQLNAAYAQFLAGYTSFNPSNSVSSLNQMDAGFDAMKAAADRVSQSKMHMPDKIPCPCSSNAADCCLGRCPEARFNYTAITSGKAAINDLRMLKCSDGTPSGQCSSNRPLECVLGDLVSNAGRCGCPSDMMQNGSSCSPLPKPCPDGTVRNGSICSRIPQPCLEGNILTPENTCSSITHGKYCQNGTLFDAASQCGCAAPQIVSGELCVCPVMPTFVCNTTQVTKSHDVTYLFDRDMKKTVQESYSFAQTICYQANNSFSGTNCSNLVHVAINPTPFNKTKEPIINNLVMVTCNRCPLVCTRNPPVGLQCGSCACPPNLGFCPSDANTTRTNVNNKPAYCTDELLKPQKVDYAPCAHGYECTAGECKNSLCYNRQTDSVQLFVDWFKNLFGVKIEIFN